MSENIKIETTYKILRKIKKSIRLKDSFSLIRFGDGGLKFIESILSKDYKQMIKISEREGIPIFLFSHIYDLWKKSANISDYIDSPQVYFDSKFWPRLRKNEKPMSNSTRKKLENWKTIYEKSNFENNTFCNPEINFLMCLESFEKNNFIELIKDKKVCCVTSFYDLKKYIGEIIPNLDIIPISGFYGNQFNNDFPYVISKINEFAKDYDIWLISAGELGRIYPGIIKFNGGRAIDIGSLVDYWCTGEIPVRLKLFMKQCENNPLKLELTEDGKKYEEFI